ncbi:type III pantothenate kinase [Reichenbachiella carrageenanivorans]|uniref:Type III pantothenate kinase n=1 Tax=Reichenbachiella carrageenanivorans TaxID=2979869 RepID=A0ABY6D2W1_9BACT|nr:type III pantothenate kinase [Reichenbachiella carrageenanivorans]UXX80506.1 type III pantothenate kinase [Reichenbachiella carrageenanivorans]
MSHRTKNIAIDIGNSSIKVGLFNHSHLEKDWTCHSVEEVVSIVNQSGAIRIMFCSVASSVDPFLSLLQDFEINILSASTPIPFENHYKTKHTLGVDRIAALAGAEAISHGKNNLVIDIGSCITYDFLDKKNIYHGGSISPGIDLRFKAMNSYTEKLPLITEWESAELIGTTTKESMVSGVLNGITEELDGMISRYQAKWPDLEVIMCGRGLNSFESKLKASIFASPKLVLVGLNRILEYNEKI